MSVIPSLPASLAQLQSLANFIDTGSSNATFVFYDNTKPASTSVAAIESAKLVSIELPKPCFKQLLADGIELNATSSFTVIKTGTAIWARLFNGNGVVVADFAVGTDITMTNPNLVLGGTEKLDSFILRVP
ncbi:hypothetical protein F949_01661 [Acinetobacter junii NIPH 182]|uniref:hypothetical protein n=1 Tax=Acinetobacter junii TaxID=40215 RepID=UPI0002D0AEE0|nr:hypothetical protein [Acinetobacter junii]ENV64272.1 hypothetical protein F949_01661 [Acinetobacter junii NIPH 182]NKG34799.1 hypothetical protein [Acinetobacter junii]QUS51158.1 hypothetical protein J5N61_06120 [Acinetobacter junii]